MPTLTGPPITLSAIQTEFSAGSLTAASTAAGLDPLPTSMLDFIGRSAAFSFTISSNQTNANLRTLAVNAGWNQSSKVVATIGSGVYISSNATGTPGLTVNGSFPGGVDLINNGFIIGMGGAGGGGGHYTDGFAGAGGGLALSVSVAVTVTNNGTIGGGGGGGGGGAAYSYFDPFINNIVYFGGGGGGGGRTGATNSSGGAGGDPGGFNGYAGAPGGAGTSGGAGVGGEGPGFAGGAGGDWGSGGSVGLNATSGTSGGIGGAGGAAGAAITGNSNITYVATGTRLGAIT